MVVQHAVAGERIGDLLGVVGHPPEVDRRVGHPLEHRPERAYGPEPCVVGEHDLVESRDGVAEVIERCSVRPDVEADVLAHQHVVGTTRQLGSCVR